jgi:hypothetical protein
MVCELSFREMTTAPKDGTPIEVRHGPMQEIALASWSKQNRPDATIAELRAWLDTQDLCKHRPDEQDAGRA